MKKQETTWALHEPRMAYSYFPSSDLPGRYGTPDSSTCMRQYKPVMDNNVWTEKPVWMCLLQILPLRRQRESTRAQVCSKLIPFQMVWTWVEERSRQFCDSGSTSTFNSRWWISCQDRCSEQFDSEEGWTQKEWWNPKLLKLILKHTFNAGCRKTKE